MRAMTQEEKKWLFAFNAVFINNAHKKSRRDLGVGYSRFKKLKSEGFQRGNRYKADLLNSAEIVSYSAKYEAFTEYKQDFENTEQREEQRMYAGYGTAKRLKPGMTVVVHIQGHYLQNRVGRVILKRHNEWLIQFIGGLFGYFQLSDLTVYGGTK